MHQVSLYLWKLQKLFYFVTGKNIDWKNKTEQLPITVQQGLFVFYWNNLTYGHLALSMIQYTFDTF